jgi:N-acetylmuramoyl-L-alanine amidase
MLRKRVEYARKNQGTIFISLHADSAPEKSAHGLSVYTLSERASDQETEALAARENKADVLAGIDLSEERDDVAGILISLAERETKNRSSTLADILVAKLEDSVELLPNTHRFAGFAVLKAPDIPSVLIEVGFLSHPAEEKLVRSKSYRDKVTGGIASGIDAYFRQQKKMGER